MGLPCAGDADEDAVAFGIQEGTGGEFTYLAFIDRRSGLKTPLHRQVGRRG
jgi:hypothetical protein